MKHPQIVGIFVVSSALGVLAFWGFQLFGRHSPAPDTPQIPVVREAPPAENRSPASAREPLPEPVRERVDGVPVKVEEVRRSHTIEGRVYEFKQMQEGLPVEPQGSLRIVSDELGRVLREESNLTGSLRLTNQRKLTLEDARRAVSGRIESARAIVWTDRVGKDGGEGRHAYEFSVDGHRKIIDAENGSVIVSKDQRRH
jgi:hypothetical protein